MKRVKPIVERAAPVQPEVDLVLLVRSSAVELLQAWQLLSNESQTGCTFAIDDAVNFQARNGSARVDGEISWLFVLPGQDIHLMASIFHLSSIQQAFDSSRRL